MAAIVGQAHASATADGLGTVRPTSIDVGFRWYVTYYCSDFLYLTHKLLRRIDGIFLFSPDFLQRIPISQQKLPLNSRAHSQMLRCSSESLRISRNRNTKPEKTKKGLSAGFRMRKCNFQHWHTCISRCSQRRQSLRQNEWSCDRALRN